MGTLKEYYDRDFNNCVKVHMRLKLMEHYIYGAICYDFSGFMAFTSFYASQENLDRAFFEELLRQLKYGETQFEFNNDLTFPSNQAFPGEFETSGPHNFSLKARFYGDMDWVDKDEVHSSRRVYIYSESDLSDEEIKTLKEYANTLGHNLQFRSSKFVLERRKREFTLNLN